MGWLNVSILVVAVILILGALISAFSGLRARSHIANASYGVARQASRRAMRVAFLRAGLFVVVALVLFGVYGLSARPDDLLSVEPEVDFTPAPTVTATPRPTESGPAATATAETVLPANELPTLTATAAPALPTATAEPTQMPTIAPTPVPTALVTSEVGLYLREAPGGTQELELLPVNTILTLLDGRETVDGAEWQQVETPGGNTGWVAVDFIEYQQ